MKKNDFMGYFEFEEEIDWTSSDNNFWDNVDEDEIDEDEDGEVHWSEMSYYRHPERMSLDYIVFDEECDEDNESLWR